jgi:hypothetical protein
MVNPTLQRAPPATAGRAAQGEVPSEVGRAERHSEIGNRPELKNAKQRPAPASLLSRIRQNALMATLIAAVVLACAVGVLLWWLYARHYESTDDAFIDARTVAISPQINGAIAEVPVDDNQVVEAGTPLAHRRSRLSRRARSGEGPDRPGERRDRQSRLLPGAKLSELGPRAESADGWEPARTNGLRLTEGAASDSFL